MTYRTYFLFAAIVVICFGAPSAYGLWRRSGTAQIDSARPSASLASREASPSSTPREQFHILLVPGHDTDTGGSNYLDVYERDVTVELADAIAAILRTDPRFDVMVARSKTAWHPTLAAYFADEEQAILDFKTERQLVEKEKLTSGEKKYVPDMANHSTVDKKTAVQLYGINKWANEHDIDMLLHVHFNDTQRPNRNGPGSSHGFTMYIPEPQLPNGIRSRAIAGPIFASLRQILTPEIGSIIEDQSLIALGASATLEKPSMLIEYAYIYEVPLRTQATRTPYLENLARHTAAGITAYYDGIE